MSWSGKSKGNVIGYKIFILTVKYAGLGTAYFVLRFVASYYLFFSLKSFSLLYYYFRKRIGYGVVKSVISIYRNYYLLGQTLIDKICMVSGFTNALRYTFHGEEYLHQMSDSKGGFLISAHVGNYEFAGQALGGKTKAKVNIVLFEGEHAKIKKYLDSVQKENSFNVIVVNNEGFDHIYKINEAIERKELICIHGDRFVPGTKTISHKFLGKEAQFPLGPFLLAVQLQAPVSFVFAIKKSNYHYHFSATKPIENYKYSNRVERDAEVTRVLNEYLTELENIVKEYPEQWFNYFPFWEDQSK